MTPERPSGWPYRYGVVCHGDSVPGQEPCGHVELSAGQYAKQLGRPDSLWYCPRCGSTADWDDDSLATAGD